MLQIKNIAQALSLNVGLMTVQTADYGYTQHLLLKMWQLPMMEDIEQYLASFALAFVKPTILRPLMTGLCTWPRLLKITTRY